ncbi:hypothetical protein AZZ80_002351, partial [Klebsiella pneumoniae]
IDQRSGARGPLAVSYTHLDVYKRQVHIHPFVSIEEMGYYLMLMIIWFFILDVPVMID